jgi:hypothetical protein
MNRNSVFGNLALKSQETELNGMRQESHSFCFELIEPEQRNKFRSPSEHAKQRSFRLLWNLPAQTTLPGFEQSSQNSPKTACFASVLSQASRNIAACYNASDAYTNDGEISKKENLLSTLHGSVNTEKEQFQYIGYADFAGFDLGVQGSTQTANTIGEPQTGISTSTTKICSLGFKGQVSPMQSLLWDVIQVATPPGGNEAPAPERMSLAQVQNLTNKDDIINALNQYACQELRDKNGNKVIANNRWIKYDYDNRPVKIVNLDGSGEEYVYDFEGQRVLKKQLDTASTEISKTRRIRDGVS